MNTVHAGRYFMTVRASNRGRKRMLQKKDVPDRTTTWRTCDLGSVPTGAACCSKSTGAERALPVQPVLIAGSSASRT